MRVRTVVFAVVSAVISAVVASGAVYFLVVRPKVKAWGVDPAESALSLPGDDLVAEPTAIETRKQRVEAAAAEPADEPIRKPVEEPVLS